MIAVLDWTSGFCWSLVYLIATFIGIRQRTYCIPSICICLNFSWEIWIVLVRIFSFLPMDIGFIIQILWAVLDIGVVYTWFRFSTMVLRKKVHMFVAVVLIMAIVTVFARLWSIVAFGINLFMSIAFVVQLDKQVHPSFVIALLKCIGTLAATVLNGIIMRDYVILLLGMLSLIMDLYYIIDLRLTRKSVIKV